MLKRFYLTQAVFLLATVSVGLLANTLGQLLVGLTVAGLILVLALVSYVLSPSLQPLGRIIPRTPLEMWNAYDQQPSSDF